MYYEYIISNNFYYSIRVKRNCNEGYGFKKKDTVFNFFEEIKNMEIGDAVNNVVLDEGGWHKFNHKVAGNARLKIVAKDKELGIFDHLFEGGR